MQLGYDPETQKLLLIASPKELRELANEAEKKLMSTRPGHSLTFASVQAVNMYSGRSSDLVLSFSADQWGDRL